MSKPFLIPAQNLSELNDRLEKLNKKASKLGLPLITTKVLGVEFDKKGRRYFQVEVEGDAPKIAGWTFLGTIEHTKAGNILRAFPSCLIPESYRTSSSGCDHCDKARRRNNTYVVSHEDGSTKQLGRQCLRDFLGHHDPKEIARMAEIIQLFEEGCSEEGFGERSVRAALTSHYLAMVVEVIKRDGWVSSSAAKKYAETGGTLWATSGVAWSYLYPTEAMFKKGDTLVASEDSIKLAADAIEFAKTMPIRSQYDANLQVVAAAEVVVDKLKGSNAGLLASLAPYFSRDLAKRVERANKMKELEKSVHFGVVGKREVFTVVVDGQHTFDSQYSEDGITLYRLRDLSGNVATWFTTAGSLEVGNVYEIKATVKKHDQYKGINQTVLTRCKVEKLVSEAKVQE